MKRLALLALMLASTAHADTYNARDFGAVPNDGIDDSGAIQAAINAAGFAGGGTVHIGVGRFHIATTLNISFSGLSVVGESPASTFLERTCECAIMRNDADVRSQRFEHFTLDGGPVVRNTALWYSPGPWRDSEMSDVHFVRYRHGLNIEAYEISRLDRLKLISTESDGIAIQVGLFGVVGGANLTISDTLTRGGAIGLLILDADAIFMRNTDIGAGQIGMLIHPFLRSNNHTFAGNFFDQTHGASVILAGTGAKAQILFADNWIASSPFGVQLHNAGQYADISFTGGRVFRIGQIGMLVDAPVAGLLIQGVQFSGINGPGVIMTQNARGSEARVENNSFRALLGPSVVQQ